MVSIIMKMARSMKVFGLMIWLMDKANFHMEMADFMTDNGEMDRKTEWERLIILMELDLKAPFKMINITALEFKYIQTV